MFEITIALSVSCRQATFAKAIHEAEKDNLSLYFAARVSWDFVKWAQCPKMQMCTSCTKSVKKPKHFHLLESITWGRHIYKQVTVWHWNNAGASLSQAYAFSFGCQSFILNSSQEVFLLLVKFKFCVLILHIFWDCWGYNMLQTKCLLDCLAASDIHCPDTFPTSDLGCITQQSLSMPISCCDCPGRWGWEIKPIFKAFYSS